jgi:nicotinamidase-related amidase
MALERSHQDATLLAMLQQELPLDVGPYRLLERGMKPALFIIDEVVGFCTPGAGPLAPRVGDPNITAIDGMVQRTDRLARGFACRGYPIWAFRDEHLQDVPEPPYPPHCIVGTGEELLVPELRWLNSCEQATVVPKRCISGFVAHSHDLIRWMNDHEITHAVVVGICTDICITDFVNPLLSARNARLMPTVAEVIVYTEACSTYDLPIDQCTATTLPPSAAHPAEAMHHIGLKSMQDRGAHLANTVSFG